MAIHDGPKEPSRPTMKRLFAVSGNLCAFPKCSTPLVDPQSGSIVGEICHVKGEKPGAARYDAAQTNEQRHGGSGKAVFVGFNGCFDWQFINWYLEYFTGDNPFGFGGIDIKSYFMGMTGRPWSATTSSQLPVEFQTELPQTHNALKAQASIFGKMLAAAGRK